MGVHMAKNPVRGDIVKINLALSVALADGLKNLSVTVGITQAQLIREAMHDLLAKYSADVLSVSDDVRERRMASQALES